MLERTPRLGVLFTAASTLSEEARLVLERVAARLEGLELRQLVRGDFLMLYLVAPRTVYLLALKHPREQSFAL